MGRGGAGGCPGSHFTWRSWTRPLTQVLRSRSTHTDAAWQHLHGVQICGGGGTWGAVGSEAELVGSTIAMETGPSQRQVGIWFTCVFQVSF